MNRISKLSSVKVVIPLIPLILLGVLPPVAHGDGNCCQHFSPVRWCEDVAGPEDCGEGGEFREGKQCCAVLGMCGPKGETCSGMSNFSSEDDPDAGRTTYSNLPTSNEVILVRALDSDVFHVVPPGESAIVWSDGTVEGTAEFDTVFGEVLASSTGVAYKVTQTNNMQRSPNQNGPWTAIAVNDLLVTCMWYQRDPNELNNSSMTVEDVATGAVLSIPQIDTIFLGVPHHVPSDPRLELLSEWEDLVSFNYAAFDTTWDVVLVTDTSWFKPAAYQTGLRGSFGEAVTPQRAPAAPGIPTVSEWGLIVLALLLLTAGTIIFGRRRRPAVA